MFGIPRDVYDAERLRGDRLEGDLRAANIRLVDVLEQLAEARRHAPRGETGRTPKAAAPVVPAPPAAEAPADPITPTIAATAARFAFGDDAQQRRNLTAARGWLAAGIDEAEVVARLMQGAYVEPEDGE